MQHLRKVLSVCQLKGLRIQKTDKNGTITFYLFRRFFFLSFKKENCCKTKLTLFPNWNLSLHQFLVRERNLFPRWQSAKTALLFISNAFKAASINVKCV